MNFSKNISDSDKMMDNCFKYRIEWPTTEYLLEHSPPEYYPVLGLGTALFVFISVMMIADVIPNHSKYLRDDHFKLSARVIMILTAYWFFSFTSLLGMMFLRGDIFLFFVANTYEAACVLAFFDMIIIYRRSIAEPFADGQLDVTLRTPPFCCCLVCLPTVKNTKKALHGARYAIYQFIFFQSGVEFIRVLTVFNCRYDESNISTQVFDGLLLTSFFIAMWVLFVLIKNQQVRLASFRLMQKFWGFKLVILLPKVFHKILLLLAHHQHISGFEKLGTDARVLIWKNFISIFLAALLLTYSKNLYTVEDYNSTTLHGKQCFDSEEEKEAIYSEYDSEKDGIDENGKESAQIEN